MIELLSEKDVEILLFVNKYKYVKVSDFKYLYVNNQYYHKKVKWLVKNKYLRKMKWYVTLGIAGKKYLEELGYNCPKISYEKTYVERQKIISTLAARFFKNENVQFIPSNDMKDKNIFTITSRRFIGMLQINKTDYLTYYISKNHTEKYIQSIIFDIRKEKKFRNVIVFVEDINMLEIKSFAFGLNKIYIIPNIEENIHLLEQIDKIDYKMMLNKLYKEKVFLSEYEFCEYCSKDSKFIFTLPFIDGEKLSAIRYFVLENKNSKVDILYSKNISLLVIDRIKNVNYIPVDFSKYIKGEFNVYE